MECVKEIVAREYPGLKEWIKTNISPGDFKAQLTALDDEFGPYASPENRTRKESRPIVGRTTRVERKRILVMVLELLRDAGCGPAYVWNMKPRHVRLAVDTWLAQGLATPTIRKRTSAVKMLFGWTMRSQAMPGNEELLPPERWVVPKVAQRDKTWTGNALCFDAIVARVPETYRFVADALTLQKLFGLRVTESLLIDVHESDRGMFLWINRGPKGNRMRFVPIETEEQRACLDGLKSRYPAGQALIGPEHAVSEALARGRYYRVVRERLGISREDAKASSHGLRAEYLCWAYRRVTGESAPIKGGRPVRRDLDRRARQCLAFIAGHFRQDVSGNYVGPVRFGWKATPGTPPPELALTPEMAFVVRHQARLFMRYAPRKVEVDSRRDAGRLLPSAATLKVPSRRAPAPQKNSRRRRDRTSVPSVPVTGGQQLRQE